MYKNNGENLSEYRFGNTLQASSRLFLLIKKDKIYWMPAGGLYYEMAANDSSKGEKLSNTGGDVLFLGTELEAGTEKTSFRLGVQHGIHDHLENSIAPARWRFTAGIQYFITNN